MVADRSRRNTRQRQVVLEELRKLTSHPTAAELYELARRRLPRISLGTVYRNLEALTEMGLVLKLQHGGGEARFDGDPERHYHVRCVSCGRISDADDIPEDALPHAVKRLNGFEVDGFRIEFYGKCPECGMAADGTRVSPAGGGS